MRLSKFNEIIKYGYEYFQHELGFRVPEFKEMEYPMSGFR